MSVVADKSMLLGFGEVMRDDVVTQVGEGLLIPRGIKTNEYTHHFRLREVIFRDKELLSQKLTSLTICQHL